MKFQVTALPCGAFHGWPDVGSYGVTFCLAIRRLLPMLAVLGLVLAPFATPALAATPSGAVSSANAAGAAPGMVGHEAGMSSDMPCCPPEKPVPPECQKECPLAALCLAKCFGGLFAAAGVPVRLAGLAPMTSGDQVAPDSLNQPPTLPPPRS